MKRVRGVRNLAEAIVSAGRAVCPLCAEPLDPQGHLCVRTNGYKREPLSLEPYDFDGDGGAGDDPG